MNITKEQLAELIAKNPQVKPEELVQGVLDRGWTIDQKKPSLLQNLGREIAKPFVQGAEVVGQGARAFGTVLSAGKKAISGDKKAAQEMLSKEASRITSERQGGIELMGGEVPRIENMKQATGAALNLASTFIGGGGAAKAGSAAIKTGLKSAIKTSAKVGAKSGALYGAGEAMFEDRNVLGGALSGAAIGGAAGAALPAVGSALVGTTKALVSPFSTAIEKVAPVLDNIALKIENVITKPSKTDIAHGFKPENVFKYGLGGNISQSLQKTETMINDLVSRAGNLRAKSKSVIDLNKIVKETAEEVLGNQNVTLNNQRISNAFKEMIKEFEFVSPTGKMNSVDAQKVKVALGKLGSWLNGQRDLDANATEAVANAFYTKFKTAIENSVGDPEALKAINKQLSDIIPIQNVLLKRIPIANRNSVLGLSDIITAGAGMVDPKGWALFVLNQLSKSGRFANLVSKGSQKLKSGATKLLPLETKLKNVKPGLSIQDVSKKANGEILKPNPLIQGAKPSQLAITPKVRENPAGFFKMALDANVPEEIKPVLVQAFGNTLDRFKSISNKSKLVDVRAGVEYMKKNNISFEDLYNISKKELSKPAALKPLEATIKKPSHIIEIDKKINQLLEDADTTPFESQVLEELSANIEKASFSDFKQMVNLIKGSEINNYIKNELTDIVVKYQKKADKLLPANSKYIETLGKN